MPQPTHRRPQLTPRRVAILRSLHKLTQGGQSPTLRELGTEVGGATHGDMDCQLTALARLGLVEWDEGVARGLRITADGLKAAGQ